MDVPPGTGPSAPTRQEGRTAASARNTVTVTVRSMVNRHDVRTISMWVADVAGVVAVQVDLASATVEVEGEATADDVRAAVIAAGYAIS